VRLQGEFGLVTNRNGSCESKINDNHKEYLFKHYYNLLSLDISDSVSLVEEPGAQE